MERLRDFYTRSQELNKYINNFWKMLGCVFAKKRKSTNGLHSNLQAVIGQTKLKGPIKRHQRYKLLVSFMESGAKRIKKIAKRPNRAHHIF